MGMIIGTIKNVIDLKKKTGRGYKELSRLRWDVNLFEDNGVKRMNTLKFAYLLYRHGLRWNPDDRED